MPQLTLLKLLYTPPYKTDESCTYLAEYGHREVIAKQGDQVGLRREAEVLRAVDFPGIPKYQDYIQHYTAASDMLIMQKMPGMPLSELIGLSEGWKSTLVPVAEAIRIVTGLAACFQALIHAGYYYRDLNLAHVIVGDTIGLVDHEWNVPVSNPVVDSRASTWETMAPEEFTVGNTMSEVSSVYTLGTVLLQLLAGTSPHHILKDSMPDAHERREATLRLVQQFSGITFSDKRLEAAINSAIQPEPEQRPPTIDTFLQLLS